MTCPIYRENIAIFPKLTYINLSRFTLSLNSKFFPSYIIILSNTWAKPSFAGYSAFIISSK